MPTTLSFHLSVNMYAFNVKSYTEYHEDKKEINKAVTGLVSVPVSKTLVWQDGLGMKEPVDVVLSMSDPATFQL